MKMEPMQMMADGRDMRSSKTKAPRAHLLRAEIYAALMICDLIAIAIGFVAIGSFQNMPDQQSALIGPYILISSTYLIFALYGKAYSHEVIQFVSKSMNRSIIAVLATGATFILVCILIGLANPLAYRYAILALGLSLMMIVGMRLVFEELICRRVRSALFDRILIVDGTDIAAPPAFRVIDAREMAIEPDCNDPMMRHWAAVNLHRTDHVLISCIPSKYRDWARFLKGSGIHAELLMPELNDLGALSIASHQGNTTVAISQGSLSAKNRLLKRLLDIGAASTLLVLAFPLMLFCVLLIKREDGGPALFKQLRVGRGNQLFSVHKFRSMSVAGDGRVTNVGRIMRSTSIDELPQLFDVLRGQMSLVGPRPHALESQAEDKSFWEAEDKYWHRHAIKPGITGLAQVRGFRGATKSRSDLSQRLQSDLEYLRGWSIWRDLLIIASTFRVMVHKNAF